MSQHQNPNINFYQQNFIPRYTPSALLYCIVTSVIDLIRDTCFVIPLSGNKTKWTQAESPDTAKIYNFVAVSRIRDFVIKSKIWTKSGEPTIFSLSRNCLRNLWAVTISRSRYLHPVFWRRGDLNSWPSGCKPDALPLSYAPINNCDISQTKRDPRKANRSATPREDFRDKCSVLPLNYKPAKIVKNLES